MSDSVTLEETLLQEGMCWVRWRREGQFGWREWVGGKVGQAATGVDPAQGSES